MLRLKGPSVDTHLVVGVLCLPVPRMALAAHVSCARVRDLVCSCHALFLCMRVCVRVCLSVCLPVWYTDAGHMIYRCVYTCARARAQVRAYGRS